MDPKTVVVILAINLIFTGLLYHLIARRLRANSGLGHMSLGSMLFGLAYVGRLFLTSFASNPLALIADVAMILGALLYLSGVRQLLARDGLSRVWLAGLALGYGAIQVMAVALWDMQGRFVLLNGVLACIYACVAGASVKWHRFQNKSLHLPYLMLAAMMVGLGLLTGLRSYNVAFLGLQSMREGLTTQIYYAYASLAVVSMSVILLWIVFDQLNSRLLEMTTHDPLTTVLNRRGLDNALTQHFANRDASALTLLEVDIDHFKRVNDEHGHAMGDLVLQTVAQALAANVRGNDFVARVGGEEFLVGCVGNDPKIAEHLGERLRACMSQLQCPAATLQAPVKSGGSNARRSLPRCTVSVGISNPFTELDERDQANREADAALYAAKAGGRNRVVKFDEIQHIASPLPGSLHGLHGSQPAPLSTPLIPSQPLR